LVGWWCWVWIQWRKIDKIQILRPTEISSKKEQCGGKEKRALRFYSSRGGLISFGEMTKNKAKKRAKTKCRDLTGNENRYGGFSHRRKEAQKTPPRSRNLNVPL
jgi:hypothetical protein